MKIEDYIEKYANLVYKICYDMLSSSFDAEDLAQETYISLYNNWNRYSLLNENEIKNIICKIALNKCRDLLKSKIRKVDIISFDDSIDINRIESSNYIDFDVIKKDNIEYLKKVINNLGEPYSRILYMYYIEEKSLNEIVLKKNVSKGTLKMQLHRGREKLKKVLEENGGVNLL